jgi:Flp pilus assembly protein CpaB
MRKKLLPLIAIAFVVAAISTSIFYSLLSGRLSANAPAAATGKLLIAAQDLKPGIVLGPSHLSVVAWSGAERPGGVFSHAREVVGRAVFEAIPKGEPIVGSRLVSRDGAGIGIPEGMRAVSIHVSDSSGVVSLLKPGHKVDVQVFASRSAQAGRGGLRTLVRGVTVLTASAQPEPSSQGHFSAPVVTVLARSREAEQLAFADSYARLRLTLRNPLEPLSEAPPSGPAVGEGTRLRVKTIALSDETALRLNLESDSLRVLSADADLLGALEEAEVKSASLVSALPRLTYYVLPQRDTHGGGVRIGLNTQARTGRIRIRAEVRRTVGGRVETRALDTSVEYENGLPIVVSGFEGRTENPGRTIVLISAAGRAS